MAIISHIYFKNKKTPLVLGIILLGLSVVLILLKYDLSRLLFAETEIYQGKIYESRIFAIGLGFLILAIIFLSYFYLQNDYVNEMSQGLKEKNKLFEIENLKSQLQHQVTLFNAAKASFNKQSLEKENQSSKRDFEISDDDLLYNFNALEDNLDFENLSDRLTTEIRRLGKSANYNLAIGGGITVAAITYLGYEVYSQHPNFKLLVDVLSYYIPRLTIIVFIEVFAFFFLKIYKSSLADIKYFHNELTNIELKAVALKKAFESKNESIIRVAITDLSKTERNFVLKKGESTIDLEKEKIDGKDNNHLIDSFKDFLKIKGIN